MIKSNIHKIISEETGFYLSYLCRDLEMLGHNQEHNIKDFSGGNHFYT